MNTDRSTTFLMANLGSEVARLYAFKNKGQNELMLASVARAKGIIDALLNHPKIGNGKQEVEILRDIINDLVTEEGFVQNEQLVQSYFIPFALRALANN